jgi:pyruvate ferredoxin oxidoreductase alpha subunit
VLGGSAYSYFRYELHLALERALAAFDEVAADFERRFGRGYDSVEAYRADDAEIVFVMIGSFSTKAKAAVDALRAEGWSVGLVRPFLLRPFPQAKLRALLSGRRAVIVVDQNLGMGKGGILHTEIGSALYGLPSPPLLLGFVGGLGGREISEADFFEMVRVARHALDSGTVPPPRLLYNRAELGALRALQAIARAQQPEGSSR